MTGYPAIHLAHVVGMHGEVGKAWELGMFIGFAVLLSLITPRSMGSIEREEEEEVFVLVEFQELYSVISEQIGLEALPLEPSAILDKPYAAVPRPAN